MVVAENSWHHGCFKPFGAVLSVNLQRVGACLVAIGWWGGGCTLEVDGCKVIGGGFVEKITSHQFTCFGGVFVLVVWAWLWL
jgi:hypothetical protein